MCVLQEARRKDKEDEQLLKQRIRMAKSKGQSWSKDVLEHQRHRSCAPRTTTTNARPPQALPPPRLGFAGFLRMKSSAAETDCVWWMFCAEVLRVVAKRMPRSRPSEVE